MWCSELKVWCCHCSGFSCYVVQIRSLAQGTSTCQGVWTKKKKKKQQQQKKEGIKYNTKDNIKSQEERIKEEERGRKEV